MSTGGFGGPGIPNLDPRAWKTMDTVRSAAQEPMQDFGALPRTRFDGPGEASLAVQLLRDQIETQLGVFQQQLGVVAQHIRALDQAVSTRFQAVAMVLCGLTGQPLEDFDAKVAAAEKQLLTPPAAPVPQELEQRVESIEATLGSMNSILQQMMQVMRNEESAAVLELEEPEPPLEGAEGAPAGGAGEAEPENLVRPARGFRKVKAGK